VWPISSTNLRKAAQTGNEDYLLVSRHKELAAALQAFLFRACDWGRAAEALVMADHYHNLGQQTLTGRLENVLEESKQKRAENQQRWNVASRLTPIGASGANSQGLGRMGSSPANYPGVGKAITEPGTEGRAVCPGLRLGQQGSSP